MLSGELILGGSVLAVLALVALLAPVFTSRAGNAVALNDTLRPPLWNGGAWSAPLGTDRLGHDVLLQLSAALRISAVVAVASVLLAGTLGAALGLLSGYTGGWVDVVIGRLTEAQLCLPVLVVAITLSIALGPSLTTIIIAITLSGWVPFARLARIEALALRERDYVLLAKIADVRYRTILRRHLLPNIVPSVLTLATQQVAVAVIEAASLSYLGLGVQPPQTDLGSMIAQEQILLSTNPDLPLIPIAALVLLALSVNVLGDHFRERLDVVR